MLLLCAACNTFAATIPAASTSRADVGAAIDAAANGDTVTIPAGTSTWTDGLTNTKALTIQGAGIGQTIIKDGIASGARFIRLELVENLVTRITGIEFQDDGAGAAFVERIGVYGTSLDNRRIRVDNCRFSSLSYTAFAFHTALGVVNTNSFIGKAAGQQVWVAQIYGSSWGYPLNTAAWGDGAWAEADNLGTEKFLFFENNVFTNLYSSGLTMIDSHAGARYVVRHNSIAKGHVDCHGAEASRTRSGRAFEIYFNEFIGDDTIATPTYYRGGVGVVWSNTISGYTASAALSLLNNRLLDHLFAPMWGSDGRNPWDINHAGNPHETGTATSAGTLTVTASAESWTNDFWTGFTVRRTSGKSVSSLTRSGATATATSTGHGFSTGNLISIWGADQQPFNGLFSITVTGVDTFTFSLGFPPEETTATGTILACLGNNFALITENTGTQLTFADSIYGAAARLSFANNDTFEINKVSQSVDQIGVTGGEDLGGVDVPDVWSNTQSASPWYEWGNTREGGADVDFSTGLSGAGEYASIVEGVHFHNDTQKPGYTPYTYPHPLTATTGIRQITGSFSLTGTGRLQ